MRPVLFHIFGFPIPSHGTLYVIGYIVNFIWAYYESRRVGLDPNKTLDAGIWMVIGSTLGSRLVHVIVEWQTFRAHPIQILYIWEGGMVLYGGVIGLIVSTLIVTKLKKLPLAEICDVVAQSCTIGLIIGRAGCLLAGCCYGREAESGWCIGFTDPNSLANVLVGDKCLYPTQIYEIILLSAIFIFFLILARHKSFSGQLVWSFYIIYPIGRFIIEFYRGDPRGYIEEPILSRIMAPLLAHQTYSFSGILGFYNAPFLSTSQFISIAALITAIIGYTYLWRKAKKRRLQESVNDYKINNSELG